MGDDWPRLAYLALLLAAIGGYFLAEGRQRLSRSVQQLAIWGLIFLGVIAAYALWGDIAGGISPRQAVFGETGRIEVPRAPDGHFHLEAEIGGTPVTFIVDTGASMVVLSREDAQRVGFDVDALDFSGRATTANGAVAVAPVRLDEIRIGPVAVTNVGAAVNGGDLGISLLGMSFLNRFARIEIVGDRLTLSR
jgi:aspartyl protease family protein